MSGTAYAVNDVITYQGSAYEVVAATSTATAPNTTQTTPFKLMVQGINWRGAWASGTQYYPGDVVSYTNGSYLNLTATNVTSPSVGLSTATWGLLAAQGATGATGSTGAAATIAVGTVTTGAAGSSATVTNAGSSSAAVFNFSIPQGTAGTNGTNGTNGSAATIAAGTTTTAVPGTNAAVSNSGSSSAATFNFTIPRGASWTSGTAVPSAGATYGSGDMYLKTDTSDVYQYSGSAWSVVANIKGAAGAAGTNGTNGTNGSAATVAVGSTTTAVPGTNAAVTNTGTSSAATLTFTVPRGATWTSGTAVPTAGATYGNGDMYLKTDTSDVYQYSGTAWTLLSNIKGAAGAAGAAGATGATPNLTIGTVTQGGSGTAAAASITGTTDNPVLNLTMPVAGRYGFTNITLDASGIGTITHNLGSIPSVFLVQPELGTLALFYAPYNKAAWTTTTAQFRCWTAAGAAANGTSLSRVYWHVM